MTGAPSFRRASTSYTNLDSSLQLAHTVDTADNMILLFGFSVDGTDTAIVSSINFAGQAATWAATQENSGQPTITASIWYMLANKLTPGVGTMTAHFDDKRKAVAGIVSYQE